MKASELIEKLQKTIANVGDLEVLVAKDCDHGFRTSGIDDYYIVGDYESVQKIWLEV